jgi:hypothetical protein
MEAVYDKVNRKVYLRQRNLIEEAAQMFGLMDTKPVGIPMVKGFEHASYENSKQSDDFTRKLQQMVGKTLYIARFTRPDVLLATTILCKYFQKASAAHLEAAKRIIRYLYHTKDEWLVLGSDSLVLTAYSDATWGSEPDTRKSRTGTVVLIGSTPVSVYSSLQETTATSSVEAEYQAMSSTTREVMFFRQILKEIGITIEAPTKVLCDNKGAIQLVDSTKHHHRTKHIDIKHHYIRDCVRSGSIIIQYIPTGDQLADYFTKSVGNPQFNKFKAQMGVVVRGGLTIS